MSVDFLSELTLSESGFLFDHSSGQTYTLNPTGQFLFRELEKEKGEEELLKSLRDEYEVDEFTARRDLDDFLRSMRELGLIQ